LLQHTSGGDPATVQISGSPLGGQGPDAPHHGQCGFLPIIRREPRLPGASDDPLATPQEISAFLAGVERRAFKHAMFAVRDEDAALDVVQDAMLKLTEKYSDRPRPSCRSCSSDPSEYDPRPFPAPEGPVDLDHGPVGARER
jgi:hypothetical protein